MRTILAATLGWALLVGALAARVRLVPVVRALGGVAGLGLIGLAVAGVIVIGVGGYKQLWRALAADVERAAAFGQPILVVRPVTATLIDVYAPHALGGLQLPNLDGLPPAGAAPDDLIRFAYHDLPEFTPFHQQLVALGYRRILHHFYDRPLYLDLYAGPEAQPGDLLDVNGQFGGGPATATGWALPPGSTLVAAGAGRTLHLAGEGATEQTATRRAPAQPGALYTLSVTGQAVLQEPGQATAGLACQAADGAVLTDSLLDGALPNDGRWYRLKIAILCPPATTGLAVTLQTTGAGQAAFRLVTLSQALPPALGAGLGRLSP